jgi:hypothetical protein
MSHRSLCQAFIALLLLPALLPAQALVPSVSSISLSADAGTTAAVSRTFTVSNPGPAVLLSAQYSDASWIKFTPEAVNFLENGSREFIVSANPSNLEAGTYTGLAQMNVYQRPKVEIPVTFVLRGGIITLSQSSITPTLPVGGSTTVPVTIGFNKSATLSVTQVGGAKWVRLDQTSFSSFPATLQVAVSAAGMPAGTYNELIRVRSVSGEPALGKQILVTMKVEAGGVQVTTAPSPLTFSATAGSTTVLNGQVNVGSGVAATYTAAKTKAWVTLSKTSGSVAAGGSDSFNVAVNPSGLAAGTHTDVVTVTPSSGSAIQLPVTLNLTAPEPALTASPTSLSFQGQVGGATPAAQNLSINNAGSAGTFSIASNKSWLTVQPASGSIASKASASVQVQASQSGLAAGTHTGTLTISCPGRPNTTVAVTLVVQQPPALAPSPTSLSFSATAGSPAPSAKSVSLSNSGPEAAFTVSDNQNWLQVTPASGSVAANGSVSLQVSADHAGLAPGSYTGTITVASSGRPNTTIPVSFSVAEQPPALAPTPSTVSFEATIGAGNPAAKSVSLSNQSAQTSFTATSNQAWLKVTPTSGQVSANSTANLSLSADLTGMAAGNYSAVLTVTAPGRPNSTVAVSFKVLEQPPALSVSKAVLSFNATIGSPAPAAQSVTLANAGAAANFTLTPSAPWIKLQPATGSIAANGSVAVSVSPNLTGLDAGSYTGTVTVAAAGRPDSAFTVQLALAEQPPALSPSPASLAFSATAGSAAPEAQTVELDNSGPEAGFTAESSAGWIEVQPAEGSVPPSGSSPLLIGVNTAELPAGSYQGTVTIRVPGRADTVIPVTFEYAAQPPALVPTPTSLRFDATVGAGAPEARNISLANTASVAAFTAFANRPWVAVTPASGSVPAGGTRVLQVAVNPTGLAAGTYNAEVQVEVPGRDPAVVPVTFVLAPQPPALSPALPSLSFTALAGQNPSAAVLSVQNAGPAVSFTATASPSWISVLPTSGSLAANSSTSLTVSVASASLSPGVHNGSITITAPGRPSTTVPVQVTVVAPTLTLGIDTVSFNLNASQGAFQSLAVEFTPGGFVSVNIPANASWLKLSPMTFTASPTVLGLSVSGQSVDPGSYQTKVRIEWRGQPGGPVIVWRELTVNLQVSGSAWAVVTMPSPVTFTVSPALGTLKSAIVGVTNHGAAANYTITKTKAWVTLSKAGGPLASGASDYIRVTINGAGLPLGNHTDTITISAPGKPNLTVPVVITVTTP